MLVGANDFDGDWDEEHLSAQGHRETLRELVWGSLLTAHVHSNVTCGEVCLYRSRSSDIDRDDFRICFLVRCVNL